MNEDFQIVKSCLMIRMPKELDHHQAKRIRETADRYIESKDISHVIFDFELTDFMDSSGIGVIMGRFKKMEVLGGKVLAINVGGGLRRIFKISGLYKVVEVIEEKNDGGLKQ